MELLVVGLGSMGKRRARLIRGVEPSAALAGVDFAPARREEARALGIEPYESIAAAVAARHFDAAFVCTAPLTHAGIIGELLDAFGPVKHVYAEKDKLSGLEIDYPDSYFVTLRHENGTKGLLAADVVSPKAVRNFEVFGEGLHLFWEGNPRALYSYNAETREKEFVDTYGSFEHDARYSDNIVENAYVDEITNFFGVLAGREQPRWSFEKDKEAIALIERIEGA